MPRLRCSPVVVAENATDSLTAANGADRALRRWSSDQRVADALVVSLGMIVRNELANDASQVPFAKRHNLIQAFLFDGPDEALSMGVVQSVM